MKKKITILSLVAAVAISGTLYFLGYLPMGETNEDLSEHIDEQSTPELSPLYLPLEPPFVVNFTHLGTLRYLQVSLEVMYHDQDILDRVTATMPAIRNSLILLLSNQKFETLSSFSGKEELREEMKMAVNELVQINDSNDDGEIYITNFVMQ